MTSQQIGIVYLIRSDASGLHKIGITQNWPRRSRELGIGKTTTEVITAQALNPRQIEDALHRHYAARRLPQSEWFSLSPAETQGLTQTFRNLQTSFQHRQEEPAIRLMVLQQQLQAIARRPKRNAYPLLQKQQEIRDHLRKHFPEEARLADEQAEAQRQVDEKHFRANRKEARRQLLWFCLPMTAWMLAVLFASPLVLLALLVVAGFWAALFALIPGRPSR